MGVGGESRVMRLGHAGNGGRGHGQMQYENRTVRIGLTGAGELRAKT